MKKYALAAFTLIELSMVVMVASLMTAGYLRYATVRKDTDSVTATNTSLDVIETALQNYRNTYGRLPCPSDLTLAENTANFGIEAANKGSCRGGTPAANFVNSAADPDAAQALYTSENTSPYAIANQVVVGAVPTKTLMLPDKYAYDSWGRKIFYSVDIRSTGNGAFLAYNSSNSIIGAIAVKNTASDTLANALTYKAIYALTSPGKNGHGGYVRNFGATSVLFDYGSTDADEQKNCHCNSSAAATAFDRIFVQKNKTNTFDDIVRYKTRMQLISPTELQ